MLVLTRKSKEQIVIGDNVTITLLRIDGNKVRIGIEAPKEIRVIRGELKTREIELSDEELQELGQAVDSEDAFAHPRERVASVNRLAAKQSDTDPAAQNPGAKNPGAKNPGAQDRNPQLFVGAVGRDGNKPRMTRAPLSRFMTAG